MTGKLLLFLLAGVIVVSGCTIPGTGIDIPGIPDFLSGLGGTTKETGDIIVITELIAVPTKVENKETIKIIANVQNVGKEEFTIVVEGTEPQLPTRDGQGKLQELQLNVQLFDYCSGLFTAPGKHTQATKKIRPQEIVQFEWQLTAGETPVTTKCAMKVLAAYGFSSDTATTISFIDKDEYSRQLQDRSFTTTSSTVSLGEGPVRTYLTVEEPQPIPADTSAKIEVKIKNEGGGFVGFQKQNPTEPETFNFKKEDVLLKADGLKVGYAPDGRTELSCAFERNAQASQELKLTEPIKLIRGGSTPLRCSVSIAGDKWQKQVTKLMTVRTDYTYEFRKEVTVTVEPKPK